MLRKLMMTTALVVPMALAAQPAQATPLLGFLPALGLGTQALVGTGATLFTTLSASAALTGIGAFLSSPFGQLLVGFGLSAIANALFRPQLPSPTDRIVNYAQPVTYMERLYGRARKGGPLAFSAFKGKKRHYGILIAEHSTVGPAEYWLDKRVVEVDGSGDVTTTPIAYSGGTHGNLRPYTGQAAQAADPLLVSLFTEVTSSHDFEGLSYLLAWAAKAAPEGFNEVYPASREWQLAPVWDGNDQIHDPRDDSTGFSRNWALNTAHELETYWGLSVDDTMLETEADACDVSVTNKAGDTIAKWELNGVLSDDMELKDILAQIIATADGYFWEKPDGTVGFNCGRWQEPTVTLGPGDFFGQRIAHGQVEPGRATEFVAKYIEPDREWREAPSGVYVADATARRIRREPALYLVTEHNQACRVLKRMAKIEQAEYRISGTIGLIGYELLAQDCGPRFARYVDAEAGFDFWVEIGMIKRRPDGVSFDIEGYSVDPTDFDFNPVTEEPAKPEVVVIEDDASTDDLTGLAGDNYGPGNLSPAIEWTWPEQDAIYNVELRHRRVTSPVSDWQTVTLSPGSTSYIITGLIEGETYEAQARNRPAGDYASGSLPDWQPSSPVQVLAQVIPPALTVSTQAAEPGRVRITGTAPTWVRMGGVRIYRAEIGETFDDAALVTVGTVSVASGAAFDVIAGDGGATDLITNGDFAAGTDWTLGTGWTIGSGVASHAGGVAGTLSQGISVSEGDVCRVTFTLLNRTAGNVAPRIDGTTTQNGTARSANGTYAEEITAPASPTDLWLTSSASFAGDIDDVKVVIDTVDCLPIGAAQFWIVPVSDTGGEGAEQGPYTLQVP